MVYAILFLAAVIAVSVAVLVRVATGERAARMLELYETVLAQNERLEAHLLKVSLPPAKEYSSSSAMAPVRFEVVKH